MITILAIIIVIMMIIYLSVALCLSRDIDQISDVVQIG